MPFKCCEKQWKHYKVVNALLFQPFLKCVARTKIGIRVYFEKTFSDLGLYQTEKRTHFLIDPEILKLGKCVMGWEFPASERCCYSMCSVKTLLSGTFLV